MKIKRLFAGASLLTLSALALTSCSDSRNVSVPTGDLDLDGIVATALNGKYSLKTSDYYNQLRYSGNNIVTNKIKEALYNKEYKALEAMFYDQALTDEQKNLLIPTKNEEKLFKLDEKTLSDDANETNFEYIKRLLVEKVNSNISSQVYSSTSAEAVDELKDKDKEEKIKKFIVNKARNNMTFTASDLTYTMPTDDSDIIRFNHIKDDAFKDLVKTVLLSEAEKLSAQNALYKIIDEEYVMAYNADPDEDEPTKNSNYAFDKDGDYLKDKYDATYKTYGTYHAIVIQYDSLREATKATEGIDFTNLTLDEIKEVYLNLYKDQYNYKSGTISGPEDDIFTFEVTPSKNGFKDTSSSITTLIKDTLEETDDISTQYLKEPRNIDNKYVMAIRYDSTYSVNNSNEETEWKDLSDAKKAELTTKLKYKILTEKASSYTTTNFKSMVYNRSNNDDSSDDIFIYDPVFEFKFYDSYTDDYTLIDDDSFSNDNIFSIKIDDNNTFNYSVRDFYNDATKEIGATTVYNYFVNEYAYEYYYDAVDSDTHDDNVEALEKAIDEFNSNENSSYPKEIGLENYLLLAYGYTTKDDVIKYYYDAKTCSTEYYNRLVYKEWAKDNGNGTNTYADGLDTSGILKNILDLGNTKYADLFKINLDHVLINIDDDADGSPDDPEEFFKKTGTLQADFEAEVQVLAQAIYTEALYIQENYSKTKSLYEVLTYVKNQYELGENMFSTGTNWNDWKDNNIHYNFLVTVEQLSSASDIDQSSVSNFVEKFKNYVINSYKACVNQDISTSFEYGKFYVLDSNTKEIELLSSTADATKITAENMCATEFGYHLLVLNSYTEPSTTAYKKEKDPSGIQSAIEVLVYSDADDSDNNIYVTIDSYNEYTSMVSFNQLFIYYCQSAMSQTSSLDNSINSLLSDMYNDIITTYKSSNFQKFLLYNYLTIDFNSNTVLESGARGELEYIKNQIIDYNDSTDPEEKSDYLEWVTGDLSSWKRPNQ